MPSEELLFSNEDHDNDAEAGGEDGDGEEREKEEQVTSPPAVCHLGVQALLLLVLQVDVDALLKAGPSTAPHTQLIKLMEYIYQGN